MNRPESAISPLPTQPDESDAVCREPNARSALKQLGLLLLLTALAWLVEGYHPGLEDDAFYLAAIKKRLHPALFPYDTDFFQVQFQATLFDKVIAWSVRLTHLPVEWAALIWHLLARCCFPQAHAQWAGVTTVALLLAVPASATGITLVDQYLHPRTLATTAILGAIVATLERRKRLAALLLALACSVHALMAAFGVSYCVFLGWQPRRRQTAAAALAVPLAWAFEPGSDAWRRAATTRPFSHLAQWQWYEWLGVFAPLLLLWLFHLLARRNGLGTLSRVASRTVYFGIFQCAVGLAIMLPPSLERLRPFEPMRFLHLCYLLFFLLAGGLIGQYLLQRKWYRWLLLFVPLSLGMFYSQRQQFPGTEHLELPGAAPKNDWVKAFQWVRENTPRDSVFALDPYYMRLPGEDYHGFRALAERSVLADWVKDAGMVARVPLLAERWQTEVDAQRNWKNFQPVDFQQLKQRFGVSWVVLAAPGVPGMTCPYRNELVLVCRVG
jgi:hypothetical protein